MGFDDDGIVVERQLELQNLYSVLTGLVGTRGSRLVGYPQGRRSSGKIQSKRHQTGGPEKVFFPNLRFGTRKPSLAKRTGRTQGQTRGPRQKRSQREESTPRSRLSRTSRTPQGSHPTGIETDRVGTVRVIVSFFFESIPKNCVCWCRCCCELVT